MRRLTSIILILVLLLPVAGVTAQSGAAAGTYKAIAHFTSGVVDGVPIDIIESASLSQDMIVLYVNWDELGMRAYRTEVHVVDPNGRVMGKIRNIIEPVSGRYYTYYYYRPSPADTPGNWTYQMYVDGRNIFEAHIPVYAAR